MTTPKRKPGVAADFKLITDKAKADTEIPPNPVCKQKHEMEHAWLLDVKLFKPLLLSIPGTERDLQGYTFGGDFGWLTLVARPVITTKFKSVASKVVGDVWGGTNCHGLLTFGEGFFLWRHLAHDKRGGTNQTGNFDAFEAFYFPGELAKKAKIA